MGRLQHFETAETDYAQKLCSVLMNSMVCSLYFLQVFNAFLHSSVVVLSFAIVFCGVSTAGYLLLRFSIPFYTCLLFSLPLFCFVLSSDGLLFFLVRPEVSVVFVLFSVVFLMLAMRFVRNILVAYGAKLGQAYEDLR